jgi:hypothetical protein
MELGEGRLRRIFYRPMQFTDTGDAVDWRLRCGRHVEIPPYGTGFRRLLRPLSGY